MKTITLDWDTYESELKQARKDGFDLVEDLHKKLPGIIKDLRGYDGDAHYKAMVELCRIESALREVRK